MKTKIMVLCGFISVVALGAGREASWGVQRALTNAVAGERAAIARYEAFAVKADEEGYAGAASLFRAAAKAERIHLARFTALMQERKVAVPEDRTAPVHVGSTRANIEAAVAAEKAERDDVYMDAHRTSTNDRDDLVATAFDQTRDVETEHANLCTQALQNLDSLKEPKAYHVCAHCGYTTDLRLGFCPVCRQREEAR